MSTVGTPTAGASITPLELLPTTASAKAIADRYRLSPSDENAAHRPGRASA